MNKTKLELEFKDEAGKKFILSLDEPRDDLTEIEVKAAMDNILAQNAFFTNGGNIVATAGARVITTTIKELKI
ncbi:DUF2922 family protein [Keratinibaculum paraultunense]|uniref:DUF2922 family protein n=1 Tax=Keratinibaculum paraultunense TaxID=1278232 RepID=A0A4R3KU24_9FIRM|nr:DUF2922 domain-containing protein [Keratinibaculum paraultunense]QQY79153.1 DUF2922 domain-containing protein [Keratinibaculum paraultunense]TCS88537.1 DUF2922 family protein [Keratinibaculum paraultunense]